MPGFNLYIDESYDKHYKFTILAGVIVPHDRWRLINTQLNDLKKRYFGEEPFNLKDMRRHSYSRGKKWDNLTSTQQNDFNNEYHKILDNGIQLVVSLIDKSKMNKKDKNTLFKLAYSFLVERFEYHLDSYQDSYGSIIYDSAHKSKEIENLVKEHKEILEKGVIVKGYSLIDYGDGTYGFDLNTPTRRAINKIIDNLTFQNDNDNNFIQIADLVAAAFSAEYNRNLSSFSSPYKKLLRTDIHGEVLGYGIKIFPK